MIFNPIDFMKILSHFIENEIKQFSGKFNENSVQ